ncbi:MAG: phosphatidate cytidylyltransferase [Acidobacteria bacterium]|nr:phosphatidate cytidylyltransferase [Acidobacteriota bacterium]
MTRVLSALVLLPVVFGTIWLLPPLVTLGLAEVVLLVACLEYATLATAFGARVPMALVGVGAAAVVAGVAYDVTGLVMMAAVLVVSLASLTSARRDRHALLDVASSLFPLVYLGVPLGAIVGVRFDLGREALVLLLATVMLSDTAQYYGGRAFGRTPLAPLVSPKKTVEGAVCGVIAGIVIAVALAGPVLGETSITRRVVLGGLVVGLGIAGDLFESQLKRGAGLKDASSLIPGHGGMLDRIDSLLFAAPGFYVFVQLAGMSE